MPSSRRGLPVAIPLSLVLVTLLAVPAAAAAATAVAGRVVDAATGRPLAGVEVHLLDTGGEPAGLGVTDRRGRYRADVSESLFESFYAVTVNAAGYVDEAWDDVPCRDFPHYSERFGLRCGPQPVVLFSVPPGVTTRGIDFALDLGGAVAGTVVAAVGGEPLAAEVTVVDAAGRPVDSALTDAAGSYRVGELLAGSYRLAVAAGGYADELWDGVVCDGRTPIVGRCDPRDGDPVPVVLGRTAGGLDFALDRLGSIAGRVTDAATGAPLAGVEVTAFDGVFNSPVTVTRADGSYSLDGLQPVPHFVYTRNGLGYVDEVFDDAPCPHGICDLTAVGTAVAVTLATATAVDFELAVGGAISGRVSGPAGQAVAGLPLAVWLPTRVVAWTESGADGGYRVTGLAAGSYLVRTVGAGEHGLADELYAGEVCVAGSGEPPCDFAAGTPVAVALGEETAAIDFTLEPFGAIAGRVTLADGGEPVTGVAILVASPVRGGGSGVGFTGFDGRYRIETLPRGVFRVYTEASATGLGLVDQLYAGQSCPRFACDPAVATPVAVASGGETAGIDFPLDVGGVIAGTVTAAASGQPLDSTYVIAFDAAGRQLGEDLTDGAGRYEVRGLAAGGYTLLTNHGGDLVDQLYPGIPCVLGTALGCDPRDGTALPVTLGETTAGPDFALSDSLAGPCVPTSTGLCLGGDRFRVGARWASDQAAGLARPLPLPLSRDAGALWFFAADNPELLVKVLDGCPANERYWVFAGGLTNVYVQLAVVDGATGESRVYDRYPGEPFRPILDTRGLAGCSAVPLAAGPPTGGQAAVGPADPVPAAATLAALTRAPSPLRPVASPRPPVLRPAAAPLASGSCVAGTHTLCLGDGRFAVTATWADPSGASGDAGARPLTADSGALWFFRPGNPELMVKVLDACRPPFGRYWIFAAGLTNLEVTLRVTDTAGGMSWEYYNPQGNGFPAVLDTDGLATCP